MSILPLSQRRSKTRIFKLGDKFFGYLDGDIFHRTVHLSRHLYRLHDGFGVDRWLIEDLEKTGCQLLCFTEKEEAKQYTIALSDFKEHALPVDHGFSKQLCCPREFWEVRQLPRQLSLMDGAGGG